MTETYEAWSILELMGHRRLGGWVTEQTIAGVGMIRIDVPSDCTGVAALWCPVCGNCTCPRGNNGDRDATASSDCPLHGDDSRHDDSPAATQFYHPSALYCLTPTSEDVARAVAKRSKPAPVQPWEFPQLSAPQAPVQTVADIDDDDGMPF